MKVIIKQWTAVAAWHWDMPEDDVCGICRVQFDGTCPTCKYPGDDCALLVGKCSHAFHMHCLLGWIQQEQSKGLCPMCRQSESFMPKCAACKSSTLEICFELIWQEFEWDHGEEEMEGQEGEGEEGEAEADGDGMEVEGGDDQAAEDTTDEIEIVQVAS